MHDEMAQGDGVLRAGFLKPELNEGKQLKRLRRLGNKMTSELSL